MVGGGLVVGAPADLAVGFLQEGAQDKGGVAAGFEAAVQEDGKVEEVLVACIGELVYAEIAGD